MKKLILLLLIFISYSVVAQKTLTRNDTIGGSGIGKIATKYSIDSLGLTRQKKSDTATYDASKYYVQQLLNSYIKWSDTLLTGKIATKKYVANHAGSSYTASNGIQLVGSDFQLGGNYLTGTLNITEPEIGYGLQIAKNTSTSWASYLSGGTLNSNMLSSIVTDTSFLNFQASGRENTIEMAFDTSGLYYHVNFPDTTLWGPWHIVTKNWTLKQIAANSGGSLGDSILKYYAPKKTFVPYTSKQSQLSFYKAYTWPDKTDDSLKLNGVYCPTGLYFKNGGRIWDFTLQSTYSLPHFVMFENTNKVALNFSPDNGVFLFNNVLTDSTLIFQARQQDSIRFQAASYSTKMGDLVKHNYINVDYKGRLTQVINNVTKTVLSTSGDLTLSGDLKYKLRQGISNVNGTTYIPALTVNVPLKLVPGTTIIDTVGVTIRGDTSKLQLPGDYSVKILADIASVNGNDFNIGCRVNNILITTSSWQATTIGATNFTPIDYEWYLKGVTANSWISFWITNLTNNDDPTIRRFKIIIEKKSE